jgi:hypothetical protein
MVTQVAASEIATDAADVVIDAELVAVAHTIRSRAESLRNQSLTVDEVLATTFRRRASELELEAWVTEIQAGLPESQLHALAA